MGSVYPSERGVPAHVEAHGPSPYARGQVTNSVLTQEPASVLVTEEPVIKKKRKRADAAQLKVLNETYARTAFPSTEERAELARKLDMSARSVQIWYATCDFALTNLTHETGFKTRGNLCGRPAARPQPLRPAGLFQCRLSLTTLHTLRMAVA